MKKRFGNGARRAFSFLLIMCLCLGCISFAYAEESAAATRTILLYDCGSNLESDNAMATWNLYQIMESVIPEGINVVVLAGGADKWQTEPEYLEGAEAVCEDGKNQIWVCSGKNAANAENEHGKMTLQTDMPEAIESTYLSDPVTLKGFIDYAAEKFPAEKYDLILWDHGGGPHGGFGVDENNPDNRYSIVTMSVGEIARALKESAVERFDIVDFDACLMSSAEIAASLSECADYLVVSAETEPGYGQEYTTWLNALAEDPQMNGFELGKIIVDSFVAFYEDPESLGYGQSGTLAVIDTQNFKERLMPRITALSRIMDKEMTSVGNDSLLLDYQDEYRSKAISYAYYDDALLDIGNFADHLGIVMSEFSGVGYEQELILKNAYTETSEEIKRILADMDDSGDDVIYAKATANMTVPVANALTYTRNAEGKLEQVEQMSPSGMSIFFAPASMTSLQYMQAMDEMVEIAEDAGVKEMLRAVEAASLRAMMVTAAGIKVDELWDEGVNNIYFKTVRDSWQAPHELADYEINLFKEAKGLTDSVTIEKMYAADWDAYIGRVIDWLDRNTNVDTQTWLSLLVAQQSSMVIDTKKMKATALDINGDGKGDACRVTLSVPLNQVKDVSLNITTEIDLAGWVLPFTIGRVHGSHVLTNDFVSDYVWGGEAGVVVRNYYNQETCAFDLPTAVDQWYEILDQDGIGHVIALHEMDSMSEKELRIPFVIEYPEPDEEGEPVSDIGYLIYRDGHFAGFMDAETNGPIIPLSNAKFNNARAYTCVLWEFFPGIYVPFPLGNDEGFALATEETNDRGMKLVMTGIDEIADLDTMPLQINSVVTDLYGYDHSINDVVAGFDNGTVLRSLDGAEITVPDLIFNRRRQDPQITVTYNGKELVQNVDYEVLSNPAFKAGTYDIVILGLGDYVGYKKISYSVLQAESSVEAASDVKLKEAAKADVTVLTVNTAAHPDNIAFDFSDTIENLRQYLEVGADGRSVVLKQGAEAGSYIVGVTVSNGSEDTYTDINADRFTIEVK